MLDALEQVAKQTRGTWYPWSRTVVVVSKETQVRDMLAKTLTARYNGADVGAGAGGPPPRAGVAFEIEPGALQRVPADARTLRVFWDNVTVQQALESLKGYRRHRLPGDRPRGDDHQPDAGRRAAAARSTTR